MEVIAFLLALGALLALLITALVLGARLSDLQAQVRRQGSLLDELRRGRPPGTAAPRTALADEPVAPVEAVAAAVEPGPPAQSTDQVAPAAPGPVPEIAPVPGAAPGYGKVEQALGTKWAVWLGGLALALGGLFLVRYTIEAGLLGPGVRVVLGGLLAAALVAAGEYARRHELRLGLSGTANAYVPGILTAAGTVVGFGTIYAAHALYGFFGPTLAFVLLGAVGVATMLAAARHGPALAGLELAGSYVTPLLVASSTPNPWPVVLFLAVVALAALLLARARRWLWLACVVVAGAVLWGVALVAQNGVGTEWLWAAAVHAGLQLAFAAAFVGIEPHLSRGDEDAHPDWIAVMVLAALTALAMIVLAATPFTFAGWAPFALLGIGVLAATAWRSGPAAGAIVLAGVLVEAVALLWPGLAETQTQSRLLAEISGALPEPATAGAYLFFAALVALAVAGVATLRLWQGRALPLSTAALYALGAIATPLVALVIAYLRVDQFQTSFRFAGAAVVLAGLGAVATEWFQRAEGDPPAAAPRLATGAYAAGTIATLAFALVAVLERGYLTVALALAALGAAHVASRRAIPMLRYGVAGLGIVVLGRIAWDPRIMGADVGATPILNWLLVGYGVPALAFGLAAWRLRPTGEDLAVRLCDGLAVLFVALLCFFEIRHLVSGGDALAPTTGHLEQGLFAFASLGLSLVLSRLDLARANPVFHWASLAFGVVAALIALVGLGVADNPIFSGEPVSGRPLLGSLLLAYLLPGLMALAVARGARGARPAWFTTGVGLLGVFLIFLYVTLSVRQGFQGASISFLNATGDAEHWMHSAAWLGLGVALLSYGLWRGAPEARLASGILVALAAIKVCVFDLAGVTGLFRALSFLGLGAVLIGIGIAYQRLVLARPAVPERAGN